mgnify:CR=1 FL=1
MKNFKVVKKITRKRIKMSKKLLNSLDMKMKNTYCKNKKNKIMNYKMEFMNIKSKLMSKNIK